MDTAEFLREAGPLIGASGSAFYFADETLDAGRELGLDALHFYYLGRGGVLGDASVAAVHSAFGHFRWEIIERVWSEGRAVVAPPVAAARFFECSAQLGRRHFADLDLADLCASLRAVRDGAPHSGLPLFCGTGALAMADDDAGSAMQLLTLLRELRGDAHLVSLLALGIEPRTAHYVRRPEYFGAFGWTPADTPALDGDEMTRLCEAEDLTDRILTPAFSAVPEADRRAVLDLLAVLHGRLRAAGRGMPLDPVPGRS